VFASPLAVAAALVVAPVLVGAPPVAARPDTRPRYVAPVDGPIVDHFRPPPCTWCAGNRGIDYAVASGSAVHASAGGVVTFAGAIGGDLYVTVTHPDGLRTSYAYLSSIAVAPGQRVAQGDVLGTTGAELHFGVRRGDVYLDPELLLAGWRLRPRLVPTDGAPGRRHADLSAVLVRYDGRPARGPTNPRATRHLRSPFGAPAASPGQPQEGDVNIMAPVVTMRQLLEAGVHFGHQTRRWNPKMKRFIFGERSGIYIIDLEQTLARIETAYAFVRDLVADGGTVLFIGTKKQAQDPIRTYAEQSGMPYVNERWLGGMLTNFETIAKRVGKMTEYERMRSSGEFDAMPKKEALILGRELEKLERNLGGIRNMSRRPEAVFVLDTKKEHIAVTEANKLGIPVVAVVDTNCDPDVVQYVIPGNDDAIRAGTLMCRIIADAVQEGRFIASRRSPAAAGGPLAGGPPAGGGGPQRTAAQEAAIAAQQAAARRQAAAAQAERDARLAAQAAGAAEERRRAAAAEVADEEVQESAGPTRAVAAEPVPTAPAAQAEAEVEEADAEAVAAAPSVAAEAPLSTELSEAQ
jgi:small subunit ribosomal protein S2